MPDLYRSLVFFGALGRVCIGCALAPTLAVAGEEGAKAVAGATHVASAPGHFAMPPGAVAGDATRGRAIVANSRVSLCVLCHTAPLPDARFHGNLAPPLAGVGSRLSESDLRRQISDARGLNDNSIMPSYARTDALVRVPTAAQGKPILSPQEIEDVVAYLGSLRD